jgi:hypothetical protein
MKCSECIQNQFVGTSGAFEGQRYASGTALAPYYLCPSSSLSLLRLLLLALSGRHLSTRSSHFTLVKTLVFAYFRPSNNSQYEQTPSLSLSLSLFSLISPPPSSSQSQRITISCLTHSNPKSRLPNRSLQFCRIRRTFRSASSRSKLVSIISVCVATLCSTVVTLATI